MTRLVTVSGPDADSLAARIAQYLLADHTVTIDTSVQRQTIGDKPAAVTVRVRKVAAPSADARQWLAGLALAGLLARNGTVDVDRAPAEAVRAADGVLAELMKEQP
jgi:hypothetical protein